MIAKVDDIVAAKIINGSKGHFRSYQVSGQPKVTVFELAEDFVFGLESFKIYFWSKTKLIPD